MFSDCFFPMFIYVDRDDRARCPGRIDDGQEEIPLVLGSQVFLRQRKLTCFHDMNTMMLMHVNAC